MRQYQTSSTGGFRPTPGWQFREERSRDNKYHQSTGVHTLLIHKIPAEGGPAQNRFAASIAASKGHLRYFRQSELDRLLRARRLQADLEMNHAGVALALDLLDTIDELKREIAKVVKR